LLVALALVWIASCERHDEVGVSAEPARVEVAPLVRDAPVDVEAKPATRKKQRAVGPKAAPRRAPDGIVPFEDAAPNPLADEEPARSCCKVCTKGKACGNSCIARSKTCHKGVGCACDS
jgi:hypothetical protein